MSFGPIDASRGLTLAAIVYGDPTNDEGARRIVRHLRWHAEAMVRLLPTSAESLSGEPLT